MKRKNLLQLRDKAHGYYLAADKASHGSLEVIRIAIKNFGLARGSEAAASLAYYALFSLFPLLLVLLSVTGFILRSDQAYTVTLDFVSRILPNAGGLIQANLQDILAKRGAVGAIGLVGSIWAASGFFDTLIRNVNRAWLGIKPRDIFQSRLLAIAMIFALVILLILSLSSNTVLNLIQGADLGFLNIDDVGSWSGWPWIRLFIPIAFSFLLFLALFRWVPNTRVRFASSAVGSLWTTLAWEAAKRIFAWYLTSRWANFQILYGSLGTVLGLMFWIYVSCVVILLGAHITASIDQRKPRGEASTPHEPAPAPRKLERGAGY